METAVRHSVQFCCRPLVMTLLFGFLGCRPASIPESGPREAANSSSDFLWGTIDGASMAPTFPGVHGAASCPRCQYDFAFDAKLAARQSRLVCPLCGQTLPRDQATPIHPAKRVKLARITSVTPLQRWAVVAYHHEDQTSVKRIVGLPGEEVSVTAGEIRINGEPLLKPPGIELGLRLPLFDSGHAVGNQLEISPDPGSQTFPLPLTRGLSLGYVHFANYESIAGPVRESIKDFYGYNQGLTRSLNICHDFGCQFSIQEIPLDKECHFQLTLTLHSPRYGPVKFGFQLRQQQLVVAARQNGDEVMRQQLAVQQGSLLLDASLIDGHARVLVGQGVKRFDPRDQRWHPPISGRLREMLNQPSDEETAVSRYPVKLTSESAGTARLVGLKVFRDIHYFERVPSGVHLLGPDQYFVVGDNVPVSRDSRNNGFYPRRSDMIGVVVE